MSVATEFERSRLPDHRLYVRLRHIATLMEAQPDASFPTIFGDGAELEAVYRFTGNDRVTPEHILSGHWANTIERCGTDVVLAIHDTTEFAFSGAREGAYQLRSDKTGYLGHFSLVVSADGSRRPLGVLGYQKVERRPREKRNWKANFNDPKKESVRWLAGARGVSEKLGPQRVIHVMDREADSYELFEELEGLNTQFVIRLAHDRRLVDPESAQPLVIGDALEKAPVRACRSVPLSGRARKAAPAARAKHPPRDERDAELEIVACEVRLARPRHISDGAESLTVRVVQVREPNPPDGQDPVDWKLVTNLPIDTPQQVERVVDIYRARWVIEEFFKALKTGCAYTERQQESVPTLERTLALSIPLAWGMLSLRWASRNTANEPASAVLSATELQCLRSLCPKARLRTAADACAAVAMLGGHLKSNGPPGWLVLARGYQRLMDVAVGYLLALGGMVRTGGSTRRSQ